MTSARWWNRKLQALHPPWRHWFNNIQIRLCSWELEKPVNRLQHPRQVQGQEEVHYSGRKARCTYWSYLILFLAQHSTALHDQEKIPSLWLLLQLGKKGEMCNRHPDFLGYCSRDWFLSHLSLGTLTGKVAALLVTWGPAENKGKPQWLAIALETAILHKDTRGSSWIEVDQPLQLGNYTSPEETDRKGLREPQNL